VRLSCRRVAVAVLVAAVATSALVAGGSGVARAQIPPAAPEQIPIGDWLLAPSAQLRTRGEYCHDPPDLGGIDPSGNATGRVRDAWLVFERTRLGLGVTRGPVTAQVTFQDARAAGTPPATGVLSGTNLSSERFGAYEAYVEAKTSAARPSFVRLGRQAVQWGDGSIVGNADWSPVARSLDALRGRLSLGVWDFELLAAILASPAPLGVAFGDTSGTSLTGSGTELFGAQVAWSGDPLLRAELVALARVSRDTSPAIPVADTRSGPAHARGETYVGSLRVFGEGRGFKYAAEGAYELGRVALDSDSMPRSAWAAQAYVGRTFDSLFLTPTLRIGAAYASGDDGVGAYKQFDPILADPHAHGAMDLFAWSNLLEAHARVSIVPWTEGRASLEYRYARLANVQGEWVGAYLNPLGRAAPGFSAQELGHEIDAAVGWRPWPMLDLGLGYSILALGDGARAVLAAQARGAPQGDGTVTPPSLSHFAYLQATLAFP
jgi:hypothetical protein